MTNRREISLEVEPATIRGNVGEVWAGFSKIFKPRHLVAPVAAKILNQGAGAIVFRSSIQPMLVAMALVAGTVGPVRWDHGPVPVMHRRVIAKIGDPSFFFF